MSVRKIRSLLLGIVMVLSMLMPAPVFAETMNPGDVKASKTVLGPDEDGNYRLTLKVQGKDVTKTEESAADVILVVDNSGSMKEGNRIETAKEVGLYFAEAICRDGSLNRIGVVGFSADRKSGGAEDTGSIKVKQNLTNDLSKIESALKGMRSDGGTNYSAALNQAYKFLTERSKAEQSRPAYVIFISDGAPGMRGDAPNDTAWNGAVQAKAIKAIPAQLFTIGISLSTEASNYLGTLASDAAHNKNVSGANYKVQLETVLTEWAAEINTFPAGQEAQMIDLVDTDKFEVVKTSGGISEKNGTCTWNIGDITEEPKVQTITIRPLQAGENIFTNKDVTLTYKTPEGKKQTMGKDKIGDPVVSVAKVTFKVVNGTWADSGQTEKVVLVPLGTKNRKGTLNAKDVPTGMLPAEGYTGGSWDIQPETGKDAINSDRIYTYSFELQKYTVTWIDEDGTELEKDRNVPYGTMPEYNGAEPEKASADGYDYHFTGWKPEIVKVTKDAVYQAVYKAEAKPTEPETKPTEPETKPTEPETKPTEPETKPTEPETKPTEPETKPTEPETKPTEPETKPTEPETKPTEPETKPDQPDTGDETNLRGWIIVMGTAVLGIGLAVYADKKSDRKEK